MISRIPGLLASHSSFSLRMSIVGVLSISSIGCVGFMHAWKGEPAPGKTASAYRCTNDVEIQCDASGCVSSARGSFTPMQVEFDVARGSLSVCAYTGCWESPATVHSAGQYALLVAEEARFSTAPDSRDAVQNIAITFDQVDRIAILKLGEFAQPMRCEMVSKAH